MTDLERGAAQICRLTALRKRVATAAAQIQSIAPGSPQANRYGESVIGKPRDAYRRPESFSLLTAAQIAIGLWQSFDDRIHRQATGRSRLSASQRIEFIGYPSLPASRSLSSSPVQNIVQVSRVAEPLSLRVEAHGADSDPVMATGTGVSLLDVQEDRRPAAEKR